MKYFHQSYLENPFRIKILNQQLENAFEIKFEAIFHINEKLSLFDNLEVFLNTIIFVIKKNCNQVILKLKSLRNKDFLREFKRNTLKEIKNDYLKFDFEDSEEKKEIKFSLSKI